MFSTVMNLTPPKSTMDRLADRAFDHVTGLKAFERQRMAEEGVKVGSPEFQTRLHRIELRANRILAWRQYKADRARLRGVLQGQHSHGWHFIGSALRRDGTIERCIWCGAWRTCDRATGAEWITYPDGRRRKTRTGHGF